MDLIITSAFTRHSSEANSDAGRGFSLSRRYLPRVERPGRVGAPQVVQWLCFLAAVATLALSLNGALASRWQEAGGASKLSAVPVRDRDALYETLNEGAPGARCDSLFGSYNWWLYTAGPRGGPCGMDALVKAAAAPPTP